MSVVSEITDATWDNDHNEVYYRQHNINIHLPRTTHTYRTCRTGLPPEQVDDVRRGREVSDPYPDDDHIEYSSMSLDLDRNNGHPRLHNGYGMRRYPTGFERVDAQV